MGMSIDEAIRILNTLSAFKRVNITGNELDDLCKLAIDTMRKYQKIQEIVKQKDYDRFNSHNYYGDFLRVQDIRKVLKDGNNN